MGHRRILLKLSGEALMGDREFGLDTSTIDRIADEIKGVLSVGVQLSLVIGGGDLSATEMTRTIELLAQDVVPHVAHATAPYLEMELT